MEITGKVFVVVGGGNGIGREVVLELLRRGGRVAAVDRSETGLAETARLGTGLGTGSAGRGERLTTYAVDITDRAAVLALPDAVLAAHGQVDGLLNVAGIVQRFVPVVELPFEDVERVMAVNFWGTVNTTKAFLPLLLERPEASLVNVSSMGALVPVPGQSAYGASKAAVKLFTEGLVAELRETRVRASVVFPGGVATNILDNSGVTMSRAPAAGDATTKLTTAPAAGAQIVDAVVSGAQRVTIGSDARMLDRLSRLMPQRAVLLVARKMKDLAG